MNTKNSSQILLAILTFLPTLVWADYFENDTRDYDSIVSELSTTTRAPIATEVHEDIFSDVMLHVGVGMVSSAILVKPEFASHLNGMINGAEVTFGIDLFTHTWLAEGAIRSYNSEHLRSDFSVSLKEFDLRVVYQNPLTGKVNLRVGAGLAARYMHVASDSPITAKSDYTTPASILFTGLTARLSRMVTIGSDLSYRSAMISETIDRSAFQAGLHMDAHF